MYFIYFLLCSSVFFSRYGSTELESPFSEKRGAALVPVSCSFFFASRAHGVWVRMRGGEDGEKIGHSSVTSRPFCHYLYGAVISGSCDL